MEDLKDWYKNVQDIISIIDACIIEGDSELITLKHLAKKLGYSEYYSSRKFSEISGMSFRNYLHYRKLSFALKELRDEESKIIDIALKYGFSSPEAFTRAFKKAYGLVPSEYRKHPIPVVLRTIIKPFDCYLMDGEKNQKEESKLDVKVYFIRIPAHKFLHIRNYTSIGYWDFWQKQSEIPGQDCETICGLLDSIRGKLDDNDGAENNTSSGQLMAWINAPEGRLCSWGIPLAESYGVRLPKSYTGPIPKNMQLMDVSEGEYIVFEHGPFDLEKESQSVEKKIETAMKNFDYAKSGYALDTTPERVFYFFHDPKRFWKYVRPVYKTKA
ncbi:MAG: helix-turn-helix transcriptional regulator [Anaeroplasmataceae bacterium]|nr:helix-turn-helix transcriptional regulator [Anaeroplasmataceae bacterium]MDE6413882.1 helix-turn-helix transcriptional regulator [Anaeroplasmataceae bacterium]